MAIAGADRVSSWLFLSSDTAKLFEMYGKLARFSKSLSFYLHHTSCLRQYGRWCVETGGRPLPCILQGSNKSPSEVALSTDISLASLLG